MTHDEAVEEVKTMAANSDYDLEAELRAAERENSIFGSLLNIQHQMPRQHAESAVVEALTELIEEEREDA
jgi:hypothetical protein